MIFLLAGILWPQAIRAGMGVRVTGGFTHISYGDFNDWIDGMNTDMAGIAEMDNITWIPEFGAEYYYSILPSLDAGIGVSMMSAGWNFDFMYGENGIELDHTVKAYPVTATVYFKPPVPFVSMKPYCYAGAGLYYSKITFSHRRTPSDPVAGYDAELTDRGFGTHLGLGIEFPVMPAVTFDLGFKIRWADLKGFEGTAENLEGDRKDVFLGNDDEEGFGPADISEKDNISEGSVDLGGYSFYVGVTIGF